MILDGIQLGPAALALVEDGVSWQLESLSLRNCGIDDALAEQILAARRALAAQLRVASVIRARDHFLRSS